MSDAKETFDLDAFMDRAFAQRGADEVVRGHALRLALSSSLYTAGCELHNGLEWEGLENRDWYVRLAFSHALRSWQLHISAAVASREGGTYCFAVPAGPRDHILHGIRAALNEGPRWLSWLARFVPAARMELIAVKFHECFPNFKPAPREFGNSFFRTVATRSPMPEEEPRP